MQALLTQEGVSCSYGVTGCEFPGVHGGERLMVYEKKLLELQLEMEDSFVQIASSTGDKAVVIMDRGALDVKAYVDPGLWSTLLGQLGLSEQQLMLRYDSIVHLVTSANGARVCYPLLPLEQPQPEPETERSHRESCRCLFEHTWVRIRLGPCLTLVLLPCLDHESDARQVRSNTTRWARSRTTAGNQCIGQRRLPRPVHSATRCLPRIWPCLRPCWICDVTCERKVCVWLGYLSHAT